MTMGTEMRLKLHIDESRIWNMGMRNVKRHSYVMDFMWSASIVKSALNITGTEKDLSTMTIFQKRLILKTIVKKFTEQIAMMFSTVTMANLMLFYLIIQTQNLFFIGKKKNVYLCQSFTTTEIQLIFLKNFNL